MDGAVADRTHIYNSMATHRINFPSSSGSKTLTSIHGVLVEEGRTVDKTPTHIWLIAFTRQAL